MTRTDVHRPSAINPSEYEWVGFECIKNDFGGIAFERERIREHMRRTGGTYSRHAHGGNCMVCGNANAIYTVLFYHRPTNTYVRMGQDCAQKVEISYDEDAFNRFRRQVEHAEHAKAGKAKAKAVLANKGLTAAWELYEATGAPSEYEENTIRDMVGKLVNYGSLSDKQYAFMTKLLAKIPERARLQAERAKEHEAAAPVPEGRIMVEGEVLSVKSVETRFGYATKMLVKSDQGWKVWGTVPSNLLGYEFVNGQRHCTVKGKRVRFTATVEKSPDDEKFGFYSRPTKAEEIT